MLHTTASTTTTSSHVTSSENGVLINRKKRRPAGTPDPDAEVVSLSPKTLLESDRYVCEICGQGFQREQNLQMHRRRHKVPWKLLKRESAEVKKRVFVCPEPTCLHHDPCHALGDLVGIKKHFRRKHSNNKQWVCEKCLKGYAVQSDYKAHLKTCGTRGHSCDCGRVFSRVESFIEHQDSCTIRQVRHELQALHPTACSSGTASSTSPTNDTNFTIPLPRLAMSTPQAEPLLSLHSDHHHISSPDNHHHNLELQLLPSSNTSSSLAGRQENQSTHLKLSIGSCGASEMNEVLMSYAELGASGSALPEATLEEVVSEQLKVAMAERASAEEARQEAKKQVEMAELEFANAKRIRRQALAELDKAQRLKEQAAKKISTTILEITCHACRQQSQATTASTDDIMTSLAMSYISSALTGGEGG